MGKITDALKKAARDRLERIERHPHTNYQYIARRTVDSKIDPHIVTFYEANSSVAEQYRILRTNIQSLRTANPIKTIAVTSSLNGEGKSVTSINLAIAMAQDLNKKPMLLVDADLRKGRVKKYLGVEAQKGLADILNDSATLEETLLDVGIPRLTILPAGSFPKNPAELLGSWKMKQLLEMLKERFEYIIIDTPPTLALTDAGIIGAQVDGVVMVVRAGHTQKGVVAQARESLRQAQAKLIGYVLTHVQYHIPDYIYRYIYASNR